MGRLFGRHILAEFAVVYSIKRSASGKFNMRLSASYVLVFVQLRA